MNEAGRLRCHDFEVIVRCLVFAAGLTCFFVCIRSVGASEDDLGEVGLKGDLLLRVGGLCEPVLRFRCDLEVVLRKRVDGRVLL